MAEQHIQLMKGLGLDDEQIKAVEALTPDQLKDWKADDPEKLKIFNPGELVTKIQTGMKNVLTNDPAFLSSIPEDKLPKDVLKKIESGQYTRFQNELEEVATKKLGLDPNDLTAEDKKSIKGLTEKIALAYLKKNNGTEGLTKMQGELSKALEAVETMKTVHADTLKKEIEAVNGKNTMKLVKTLTKVELQGLDDVDLAVAANYVSDPVLATLNEKYAIVLDANDNLDLKQKEQPALDVLDKTGKKITFQQALKETVIAMKLGTQTKVDPDNPKGKKKVIIEGGGGDAGVVELPEHIKNKIDAIPVDKT